MIKNVERKKVKLSFPVTILPWQKSLDFPSYSFQRFAFGLCVDIYLVCIEICCDSLDKRFECLFSFLFNLGEGGGIIIDEFLLLLREEILSPLPDFGRVLTKFCL